MWWLFKIMNLRNIVSILLIVLGTQSYARTISTHPASISNTSVLNPATIVSFDLDETLIESNHLTKAEIKKAKDLGYEVKTTVNGQDYIIRPGAKELLEFAKSQGFSLMLFTHNMHDYAEDILESSGMAQYFTKIKSHEDVIKPYNVNFQKYPNHRNRTYPQKSVLEVYTVDLYQGFFVNGFERMQGEHNIHSFIPCANCAKYPPLYGARIHIDNTEEHIARPVDFVGILVEPFFANKLEASDANGHYLWVEKLKPDLIYLKEHDWVELYKLKYGKEPITDEVEIQSYTFKLEYFSKYLLDDSSVSILS